MYAMQQGNCSQGHAPLARVLRSHSSGGEEDEQVGREDSPLGFREQPRERYIRPVRLEAQVVSHAARRNHHVPGRHVHVAQGVQPRGGGGASGRRLREPLEVRELMDIFGVACTMTLRGVWCRSVHPRASA